MGSDNSTLSLGDIVRLQRGNTYKSPLLGQPGPVLLGLASIQRNGGFRGDSLKTYGGESAPKMLLYPGDLYVSLKDVTQSADLLGSVAMVPKGIQAGRLTQDTVKLEFVNNTVARDYIYWLLRTPFYRQYCSAHRMGTTNLSLSREDFLSFPVPLPDHRAMEIVGLLEDLEQQIALLRETSTTLESIAQALFKSWFVDFDPVCAKAEGRDPEGVSPELADLFPSEFEDSELGLIPKGWMVASLDTIAHFLNGLAMQKFPVEGEAEWLPVIKIAQLRKGDTEGADRASIRIKPEYIIDNGDVLFSWSGSLEADIWCGGRGGLNQHLFKVTSKQYPKWFYYLWIRHHLPAFREIAANKATTMGHIQRHHLTEAGVVIPPPSLLHELSKAIEPLIQRATDQTLQSNLLANLRDTLLPRLMSGKLRVPNSQEVQA